MTVTLWRFGRQRLTRIGTSRMAQGKQGIRRYEPGEFELTFPPADPCAAEAKTDDMLLIGKHAYLIEGTEKHTGNTSHIVLRGRQLAALADRRQIIPDDAAGRDMPTGFDSVAGSTETVIKHYLDRHLVSPVNPARRIPCVRIAEDRNRGIQDDAYHARYVNLMETVNAIGKAARLSVCAGIDPAAGAVVLDVEGTNDRTAGGSSPLLLRMGDGRLDEMTETSYVRSAANVFYASRAGDRYAYETLTQTYFSREQEPEGLERMETSISVSVTQDAGQYAEMRENAEKVMPDYAPKRAVTCGMAAHLIFGEDYNVGDVVCIAADGGTIYEAEITAVEITESGQSRAVSVTIGDPVETRFDRIKRKREV